MLSATNIMVKRASRLVLHGVSVVVEPGKLTAVVGPNGAGKSTLIGAMTCLLPLSSGQVTLDGEPADSIPRRLFARRVGVLQQRFHATFPFKVHEIVAMGRSPFEGTEGAAQAASYIRQALETVEVEHLAEQSCQRLSGGELQRVYLARSIAQLMPLPAGSARYLLLDEPTASLDLRYQATTLSYARAISRQGAGVLAVLHDLNLAAMYADEIVLLRDGQVAASGTPKEVLTEPVLTAVYQTALSVFADPNNGRPVVLPADHYRAGPAINCDQNQTQR